MPDQMPKEIIDRINGLLENKSISRAERRWMLEVASRDAWDALFPESRNQVSIEEQMRRCENVRKQLSNHPNGEKIGLVIDSRVSGAPFRLE